MRTILGLLKYLKPFTSQVFLSVFLGVATIACSIGLLGTSAYLIATAALHPSIADLQVAIVGVRFFGISRSIFRYLERLVSHSVNFKLLASLRLWVYRVLEPLAPARLPHYKSGDIFNRVVADIDFLENFYIRVAAPPIVALIVTVGAGWFVGWYQPVLGWILVGGMTFSGVGLPLAAYFFNRKTGTDLVNVRTGLSETLVDGIQGAADILAFNQGARYVQIAKALVQKSGQIQRKLAWKQGITDGVNNLMVNLTLWTILIIAIPLVRNNHLSGISLAVISLIVLASFEAVNPLGLAAQYLDSSIQSARRLFSLGNITPAAAEPIRAGKLVALSELHVNDLSFRYDETNQNAITNFNLDLKPGRRIGLIGPNGSGKSTLFNILLRFWDYQDGSVRLGDVELRDLTGEIVRSQFGLVTPTTYIFNDSIKENLLLASSSASDQDLVGALEKVSLGGWLKSLPQGLNTRVGEHGVKLSGGERQRLALARLVLRDSPIFLLDEPTIRLDAQTERDLIHTILDITSERSLIWIAHNLAGMRYMDEIIMMQSGNIIERGKHDDLIRNQGEYWGLWRLYSNMLLDE